MTLRSPFGWRISWIAVKGAQASAIASELQLVRIQPSAWEEGIQEAGKTGFFITPMISDWALIVGLTLPDASDEDTLPLVVRLSEVYGSAQYFGNHRVTDYYAWARAENGRLIRAYAYLGEQGTVLWDRGELTKEEVELKHAFDGPEAIYQDQGKSVLEIMQAAKDNPRRYPDENDVFSIAGLWSIDPTRIEDYEISQSTGLLGYSPNGSRTNLPKAEKSRKKFFF